jgi:hypothetical protein
MGGHNHDNYQPLTKEECDRKAAAQGLVCVFASDSELLLDMDSPYEKCEYPYKYYQIIENLINIGESNETPIRTKSKGGNTHIYIRLAGPTSRERRLCLHACLGSDPMRENVASRYLKDEICLFETPEEAERVAKWRASTNTGDIF